MDGNSMNLLTIMESSPATLKIRDNLESAVDFCNMQFNLALARGDEEAMDYWHSLTRKYENQHYLANGIAACGVGLQYGVSDANGHAYKKNAEELRGLHKLSDIVLDELREEGICAK